MRNQRSLIMILAVSALLPTTLRAQEGATVFEGDRVRISGAELGERPCEGEVLARSSETLTVDCWQPSARRWETVDFPVGSISSLEVRRGTKSNTGKGALIGGLIGGGFGLALGIAAAVDDCPNNAWTWDWCWWSGGEEMIPLSTATFGLVGAGAGALIGMLNRSEKWVSIRPDKLRVGVAPRSGGFVVAFSVRL